MVGNFLLTAAGIFFMTLGLASLEVEIGAWFVFAGYLLLKLEAH
jgi:hypothetical protein